MSEEREGDEVEEEDEEPEDRVARVLSALSWIGIVGAFVWIDVTGGIAWSAHPAARWLGNFGIAMCIAEFGWWSVARWRGRRGRR